MIKSLVIASALALLMGVASISMAQDTETGDDTQKNVTANCRGEMRGMEKFHRGIGVGMETEGLSEEQIEKLQEKRTAFKTATQDLRMELQSKRLALQSELAKKAPDAKTAKSLQKEISALNAELAQKRIEHILEMKEIAPGAGMGLMRNEMDETPIGRGRRNT